MPAIDVWQLPLIDLQFEVGTNEDWVDSIELLDEDGVTPLDLTGISFRMQVRKTAPDHTVLIDASTTAGTMLVGNGVIGLYVLEDTMRGVPPGDYVLDIVGEKAGRAARLATGTVKVLQGVTR